MKKEWEYDSIFGDKQSGDIRKEHTIYHRMDNGSIKRTTIVRIYYGNEDYQDSVESVIIPNQG